MKDKLMINKEKLISILAIILFIIIILGIILAVNRTRNLSKVFTKTNISFKFEHNSFTSFYPYNKNFFVASKDGVVFFNDKGNTIWEDSFEIEKPILIAKDNIVLITEKNGKKMRVYNEQGLLYSKDFPEEILSVCINKSGYSGVILKKESYYSILVFNAVGDTFQSSQKSDYNIYPVSLDLSDDGRMVAYSLIDVNGIELKSKVLLSYLKEEIDSGDITSDSGISFDDQLISKVEFMKNNNIVLISDKEIICLKESNSKFENTWAIPITNIDKVFFYKDSHIVIANKNNSLDTNQEFLGKVTVYDLAGKETNTILTKNLVTYLNGDFNSIIIGEDKKFVAYKLNGGKFWNYDSLSDIKQIFFFKNIKSIIEVTDIDAGILNLSSSKNKKNKITPDSEILPEEEFKPEETVPELTTPEEKAPEEVLPTENSETE